MKPRISVVINTLNEERNLPFALRSVRDWVDEIIVVDMHSDDRTADIAREFGARVSFHERLEFVEPARNFAVQQTTGDWVLILDADELVPRPMSRLLMKIALEDTADIVVACRLNFLLGKPLRYTGWAPHQDLHAQFFKKNKMEFTSRIHGSTRQKSGARVVTLPCRDDLSIHHFNYVDSAHFLEKLNRYTSVEARQAFERGERIGIVKTIALVSYEFLNRFIRKQGFRDGWRGFYLSGFMAMYRLATSAKLQEIYNNGDHERVVDIYRDVADVVLAEYQVSSDKFASPAQAP